MMNLDDFIEFARDVGEKVPCPSIVPDLADDAIELVARVRAAEAEVARLRCELDIAHGRLTRWGL